MFLYGTNEWKVKTVLDCAEPVLEDVYTPQAICVVHIQSKLNKTKNFVKYLTF